MDIKVTFSESNDVELPVVLSETDESIAADFGEIQSVSIGAEMYEGDYFVTPKVEGQTIPTKGKVLIKDMTVNPIPFFDVSNTSGGSTVYIAKEI